MSEDELIKEAEKARKLWREAAPHQRTRETFRLLGALSNYILSPPAAGPGFDTAVCPRCGLQYAHTSQRITALESELARVNSEWDESAKAVIRFNETALKHYHENTSLKAELARVEAERDEARLDIANAVREAKHYQPDYPWTQSTASEAVWALGQSCKGVVLANEDLHQALAAARDRAAALVARQQQV